MLYFSGFLRGFYLLIFVQYWFEVTNTTVSPDGIERIGLAVNGSIPGPTIEANWGDTVGKSLSSMNSSASYVTGRTAK